MIDPQRRAVLTEICNKLLTQADKRVVLDWRDVAEIARALRELLAEPTKQWASDAYEGRVITEPSLSTERVGEKTTGPSATANALDFINRWDIPNQDGMDDDLAVIFMGIRQRAFEDAAQVVELNWLASDGSALNLGAVSKAVRFLGSLDAPAKPPEGE